MYFALQELGFEVEIYCALEIDRNAIAVSRRNFGNSVTQLGNLNDLSIETLMEYGPFNLVFMTPPCNALSKANPKKPGLKGKQLPKQ